MELFVLFELSIAINWYLWILSGILNICILLIELSFYYEIVLYFPSISSTKKYDFILYMILRIMIQPFKIALYFI